MLRRLLLLLLLRPTRSTLFPYTTLFRSLMITVEYPPGSSDPIHRHNAHAFIYVLEGSIVMQVRGGKETVLTPASRSSLRERSEEHTSELQSHVNLVCRLLLEKKKQSPRW